MGCLPIAIAESVTTSAHERLHATDGSGYGPQPVYIASPVLDGERALVASGISSSELEPSLILTGWVECQPPR